MEGGYLGWRRFAFFALSTKLCINNLIKWRDNQDNSTPIILRSSLFSLPFLTIRVSQTLVCCFKNMAGVLVDVLLERLATPVVDKIEQEMKLVVGSSKKSKISPRNSKLFKLCLRTQSRGKRWMPA
ncbi:hypothetical protein ACLB2K_071601 [Fragaria x ananassa]